MGIPIAVFILVFAICIVAMVAFSAEHMYKRLCAVVGVTVILAGWIAVAFIHLEPYRAQYTSDITKVHEVQCVYWTHNQRVYVVNVNKYFNRVLDKDDVVFIGMKENISLGIDFMQYDQYDLYIEKGE